MYIDDKDDTFNIEKDYALFEYGAYTQQTITDPEAARRAAQDIADKLHAMQQLDHDFQRMKEELGDVLRRKSPLNTTSLVRNDIDPYATDV